MVGLKGTYERFRATVTGNRRLDPPELIELATAAYLVGKDDDSLTILMQAHHGDSLNSGISVAPGALRRASHRF